MPLRSYLATWWQQHRPKQILLGFSGGVDSQVLLHLLAELRTQLGFQLRAMHVNHHLSPNNHQWQKHCQQSCLALNVPFVVENAYPKADKDISIETAARNDRYALFKQRLLPQEVLVTAHHQDDQAETVLLQLFRGTGLKGIGAIKPWRAFEHGFIARPLLAISKSALENYAFEHNLLYCQDESNVDTRIRRNFVRHQVMPLVQQHYPDIHKTLVKHATLAQESQGILDDYLSRDVALVSQNNLLDVHKLIQFNEQHQRALLRHWLHQQGAQMPSLVKCGEILKQIHAKADAAPKITWHNVTLLRYKNKLVFQKNQDNPVDWSWQRVQGKGIKADQFGKHELICKPRQGGEKIPMPGGWHKSVKKLLQEHCIPPWQRAKLPLVYANNNLIAVGNLIPNPAWRVDNPDEWGWEVNL